MLKNMAKRLRICLINPKFEPSYWGFDYALPLYPGNKKSSMITGAKYKTNLAVAETASGRTDIRLKSLRHFRSS